MAKAIRRPYKGGASVSEVVAITDDEFDTTRDYVIGNYVIKDSKLYRFISDKEAGEWDESKVVSTSLSKEINNLTSSQNLIDDLNGRLTYIEENLGTLTEEEYSCKGSVNFGTIPGYESRSSTIYFDKIYLEPPAVKPSVTASGDTSTLKVTISNITTSGCTVSIYNSIMRGYSTSGVVLSWTATGYVKKVS